MLAFISGGGLTAARGYGLVGLVLFISGGGLTAARCFAYQRRRPEGRPLLRCCWLCFVYQRRRPDGRPLLRSCWLWYCLSAKRPDGRRCSCVLILFCHLWGLLRPAGEDVITVRLVDVWEVFGVSPTTSMDGSSSRQTAICCLVSRVSDLCNGGAALVVRLFEFLVMPY